MLFCRAGPVYPAVGAGNESPSHGFAVPAPFRQGDQGDGERIATGALRPRNDRSRKNLRVIPRPVRRLVVGIRNTPAQRTRRTDCHTSDIGHWFAMTGGVQGVRVRRHTWVPPYKALFRAAGGQRHSPLRRDTRSTVRRGVCVEENSKKCKSKKPIAFAIGFLVGDGGFEPPKASPADLQSVPFGHSGNPPYYL